MNTRWPLHRSIGIGIILIGVAPVIYSAARIFSHNWVPLSVPLRLVPGEFHSPEFKTDINDGRYLVELRLSELPNLEREKCEMGIPLGRCESIDQTVDFDWQVVSIDGETVQSGQYKLLFFGGVEVGFGEFRAKRGGRYKVLLHVRRDAGELNTANPTLVVESGGEYWEEIPDLYGYSLLWAKYVGGLGLLWLLLPVCFMALRRRKDSRVDDRC